MNRDLMLKQLTRRSLPTEVQVVLNHYSDKLDICVDFCFDIQLLITGSGKLNEKTIL